MKKLSKRLLQIALLMLFVFTASISYAQENFKDTTLSLLENVAFNSSYNNIKDSMKQKGYDFDQKFDQNGTEMYGFKADGEKFLAVGYTSSQKLSVVQLIAPTAALKNINSSISEKKFIKLSDVSLDWGTSTRWEKKAYPFQFSVQLTEVKGAVILVTKENDNFIKNEPLSFSDDDLALLEKVAFESDYNGIKKFLKQFNYEFRDKRNTDGIEYHGFVNDDKIISVQYNKSQELLGVTFYTADLSPYSAILLISLGFNKIDENDISQTYKKGSYPYQFCFAETSLSSISLYTPKSELFIQ